MAPFWFPFLIAKSFIKNDGNNCFAFDFIHLNNKKIYLPKILWDHFYPPNIEEHYAYNCVTRLVYASCDAMLTLYFHCKIWSWFFCKSRVNFRCHCSLLFSTYFKRNKICFSLSDNPTLRENKIRMKTYWECDGGAFFICKVNLNYSMR